MEVNIGRARTNSFDEARRWFALRLNDRTLQDAFDVLMTHYVDCSAFVEVDVPATQYAQQVDLILAADDRVAVVEVKSWSFDNIHNDPALRRAVTQAADGGSAIQNCLKQSHGRNNVTAILFLPRLGPDDIAALRKLRRDSHHLAVEIAGGHRCRGHQPDQPGDATYFPDVLRRRLARLSPEHVRSTTTATQFVRRLLCDLNGVHTYRDYSTAIAALRRDEMLPQDLLLAPHHLSGSRQRAMRQLCESLDRIGYAEVIGPAGIGKSELILEYLNNVQRGAPHRVRYVQKSLKPGTPFTDVVIDLLERFDETPDPAADARTLLRHFVQIDGVTWITAHSPEARATVLELLAALEEGSPSMRLCIESIIPAIPNKTAHVLVEPMTSGQVFQVLERAARGNPRANMSDIATWSQGNPRLAIARWTSSNPDETPSSSTGAFTWMSGAFGKSEQGLLQFIVGLLDDAPFGVAAPALETLALKAGFSQLDLGEAIGRIVKTLESHQLVYIDDYRPHFMTNLVPAGLVECERSLSVVRDVDPALTRFVLKDVPIDLRRRWYASTTETLMEQADRPNLAEVTAALRVGDLWHFCKSAFRHTHRGNLIAWANAHPEETQTWSATDRYLERAVRVQQEMFKNPTSPFNLDDMLGRPDSSAPRQRFIWDTLKGRANCYVKDGRHDFDAWRSHTESLQDNDVRAESLGYMSEALQREGHIDEGWRIIEGLLAEVDSHRAPVRGKIYFHAFSFLNRAKEALTSKAFANSKPAIAAKIADLAPRALAVALELENTTYLASTVFYTLRSFATTHAPRSEQDLDDYLSALRFVEKASPVRRMQVILTSGTLHRHYCLRNVRPLGSEEFAHHMDEAFACYRRAFQAAATAQFGRHRLNAASYCAELCLGSVAHQGLEILDRARAHTVETLEMFEQLRREYPTRNSAGRDGHIWDTTHRTYPFLNLLALDAESHTMEFATVFQQLSTAVTARWEEIGRLGYRDRIKHIEPLLELVECTLRAFRQSSSRSGIRVETAYRAVVQGLCRDVRLFARNHRTTKPDSRVKRMIRRVDAIAALMEEPGVVKTL